MKDLSRNKGFTLVEVALSVVISAAILAGIVILFRPVMGELEAATEYSTFHANLRAHLDGIKEEIQASEAVYVDDSACYAFCFYDKDTEKRTYYYWDEGKLYRKKENATGNNLSCNNGNVGQYNFEQAQTSFSKVNESLKMEVFASGENSMTYRLRTGVFPIASERSTLFFEGFECKTLTAAGWVLSTDDASYLNWKLSESSYAVGRYRLRLDMIQSALLSARAEIPLNFRTTRVDKVHLRFKYKTNGTMSTDEKLIVEFYDGTSWNEVFRDNLEQKHSSWQEVVVDLSGYTLGASNKLRFTGWLRSRYRDWYVDDIEIFTP